HLIRAIVMILSSRIFSSCARTSGWARIDSAALLGFSPYPPATREARRRASATSAGRQMVSRLLLFMCLLLPSVASPRRSDFHGEALVRRRGRGFVRAFRPREHGPPVLVPLHDDGDEPGRVHERRF